MAAQSREAGLPPFRPLRPPLRAIPLRKHPGRAESLWGKWEKVNYINVLVGETGFEPATLCSQSRCATRLRYSPTCPAGMRRGISKGGHSGGIAA